MNNLFLPEIDLSGPPEFNMHTAQYWSLKNRASQKYLHVLDVFDQKECAEIIKIGKSFRLAESNTFSQAGFSETRKSKNSWIPPSELSNWIYEKIQIVVFEINKHYEYDLHSMEPLQFTEYDDNYKGHYSAHVDAPINETSPNTHRKLSFSIQLTNENNYEGGDLLMYTDSKSPQAAIRQQGTINFFPSFVLHEVTPVTKGTRYCLVGWVAGPKFK